MNRRHTLVCCLVAGVLVLATPLLAQVTGSVAVNNDRLQGTHANGQLMIFTPDPIQPGSSLSHWDTSAVPNLLMEPAINADLGFLDLDLTTQMMSDIGWPLGNLSNIRIFISSADAGAGFDDPRPFPGAPGNPATTLGQARANLFDAVLTAWGMTLQSDINVDIFVGWDNLPCSAGQGAVVASASPSSVFQGPGLPQQNVWYVAALAESLLGENRTGDPTTGGNVDLFVMVNEAIDNECLGVGTSFYYGLDGNNPSNQIDLAPTVLHEVGHGLGFTSLVNDATGALFNGLPSTYELRLTDQRTGKAWPEMTDTERARSARNFRQVTWTGEAANQAGANLLDPGPPELQLTGVPELDQGIEVGGAAFGGDPLTLDGEITCMFDGVNDATPLNGCTAASNAADLAGKIALIDRGGCGFTTKAANAQAAGAAGAIIVNNAGNAPIGLGGTDPNVTIPVISVSRKDGNVLRQAVCGEAAGFVQDDRFQVTVQWERPNGDTGTGNAMQLTDDTLWFWFFNPANVEMVAKIVDGCGNPNVDGFLFFAAGLTNVEVDITVIDTQTGQVRTFQNPQGQAFQPIQDLAFTTCP